MLSSLKDYFYRGFKRTARENEHMNKSPEAQYQQNQEACGGLQCFEYECCFKQATNGETWRLYTHTSSTLLQGGHPKLGSPIQYLTKMLNMVKSHLLFLKLPFDLWNLKCNHFIVFSYKTFA